MILSEQNQNQNYLQLHPSANKDQKENHKKN